MSDYEIESYLEYDSYCARMGISQAGRRNVGWDDTSALKSQSVRHGASPSAIFSLVSQLEQPVKELPTLLDFCGDMLTALEEMEQDDRITYGMWKEVVVTLPEIISESSWEDQSDVSSWDDIEYDNELQGGKEENKTVRSYKDVLMTARPSGFSMFKPRIQTLTNGGGGMKRYRRWLRQKFMSRRAMQPTAHVGFAFNPYNRNAEWGWETPYWVLKEGAGSPSPDSPFRRKFQGSKHRHYGRTSCSMCRDGVNRHGVRRTRLRDLWARGTPDLIMSASTYGRW